MDVKSSTGHFDFSPRCVSKRSASDLNRDSTVCHVSACAHVVLLVFVLMFLFECGLDVTWKDDFLLGVVA